MSEEEGNFLVLSNQESITETDVLAGETDLFLKRTILCTSCSLPVTDQTFCQYSPGVLHFLYLVTGLLVWKVPTLYKNSCRLRKKHGGQRSVFPDALFLYSNYLTFGIDICSYRW